MRRMAWLFLLTALAACAVVPRTPGAPPAERPLLILVSFDGWRWDYDTKAPTPHLRRLMARGVRAEGLIPAFPSKTVPNHYSIVTGLYPGHHGMVANVIRDPQTGRLFERTNRREVEDPMWWGGDPVWNTAQRAGLIAATMFWPGSEAPVGGMQPRYWREFDEQLAESDRVAQVLAWLDRPVAERPHLLTLYLNEIDTLGHWYGPDSAQVRDAIVRADAQLGMLVSGLQQRRLLADANLVVLSDHGMAATTRARTIVADEYIALADVEIADINPTLGVTPRRGREQHVFQALRTAHPHLKMYERDNTPAHWHLRRQMRVPPITGVADEGWVVVLRRNIDEYWKRSADGGQHGYEPRLRSMRGIFVAAGPAFRDDGEVVPAFENVDVYNALAIALGVTPSPNDGDPGIARRLLRQTTPAARGIAPQSDADVRRTGC
jgi:predicted AlkP superfamily pyrophosphatase or phosphodiesterase